MLTCLIAVSYDNHVKAEAQRWVQMADADLVAARVLLKESLFALSIFHCQQAVEKLLKAIWIERMGEGQPPRTHNLTDLAQDAGLPLEEWQLFLRDLTNQAVASRYAGNETYPLQVADEYYRKTEELCAQLRQHLK